VDLYDDVIAAPAATNSTETTETNHQPATTASTEETNGNTYSTQGNNITPNVGRRHQLYVGNLTWVCPNRVRGGPQTNSLFQWTTDQDIANAVHDIGVNDFHEVKFFEHRANGQSKGFCVISLGSEASMRLCMDHLPKKEINGQNPVVTLPTKQALSNFESQSKTRPSPTNNSNNRNQHPSHANNSIPPGPHQNYGGRMPMNNQMRGPMPPGMPGPGVPRMQGPPGYNGPPQMNQGQPPRFQGQPQWNGPRPNGPGPNMGPMRPGPPPQGPPRPPMVKY
jgi:cleavage and polyadenylation specificity factor subunit 6/7